MKDADNYVATATIPQIDAYLPRVLNGLTQFEVKNMAKALRMRYRELQFDALLNRLVEDANGTNPLNPVAKRAMFRVMRQNIADMVSDVAKTSYSGMVESINHIRPLKIKRNSCGSAQENPWDFTDVSFDVMSVAKAYSQLREAMCSALNNEADSDFVGLSALVFLSKHGILNMGLVKSRVRHALQAKKEEMRHMALSEIDTDDLGALLSFHANGLLEMTEREYNMFGEELRGRIIGMLKELVIKYSNVHKYYSFEELCQDAMVKIFAYIDSFSPARGKFSTWAWMTIDTSLFRSFTQMKANSFVCTESGLSKEESKEQQSVLESAANHEVLRDYERSVLFQQMQDFADFLCRKMPKNSHIIKAIFGSGKDGLPCDDLNFNDIAERSSRISGRIETAASVRRVFLNEIRPAFIREFSN